MNLEDLKKITVVKVVGPEHKKFRRIEDKDKILLGYLGINLWWINDRDEILIKYYSIKNPLQMERKKKHEPVKNQKIDDFLKKKNIKDNKK